MTSRIKLVGSLQPSGLYWLPPMLGGLGDIYNYVFNSFEYQMIDLCMEYDISMHVALCSHNPSSFQILYNHPSVTSKRCVVYNMNGYDGIYLDLGYKNTSIYKRVIDSGAQPIHSLIPYVDKLGYPKVYVREDELHPIRSNISDMSKCIVINPSAGETFRSIPHQMVNSICELISYAGYLPVIVGSSYTNRNIANGGSIEVTRTPDSYTGIVGLNLIDQLTIPALIYLIENSHGVVSAFTSTMLLSWYLKRNTFVIMPHSREVSPTDNGVMNNTKFYPSYQFGFKKPNCIHAFHDTIGNEQLREKTNQLCNMQFRELTEEERVAHIL